MAGFQKFPVPRSQFYMPWAYNKRWKQQTAMVMFGTVIWGMIIGRYLLTRMVYMF